MTKEEINRRIAEEVMGWTFRRLATMNLEYWEGASEMLRVQDWNPCERIDHAWMVVEKFDGFKIEKLNNAYACRIHGRQVGEWDKWYATAQMAICLASLEAKEGKDE